MKEREFIKRLDGIYDELWQLFEECRHTPYEMCMLKILNFIDDDETVIDLREEYEE